MRFGSRSERDRSLLTAVLTPVCTLVLGLLAAGCAAGDPRLPDPMPTSPTASPTPARTGAPPVPPEGLTLAELGFVNGPRTTFSVPGDSVIAARVDQPNNVTVVLSAPSPTVVAAYLLDALPRAGYQVVRVDAATSTFTFVGHGWSGSVTATDGISAVLLRPI